MHNNVVLYGGGLDSTALVLYLLSTLQSEIILMHFDYGQKAAAGERRAAQKLVDKYPRCRLVGICGPEMYAYSTAAILNSSVKSTEDRRSSMLELRNPLLLVYAASYWASRGEEYSLWLGFHEELDDVFPDARAGWLLNAEAVINSASHIRGRVRAPFKDDPRIKIFQLGLKLDPDLVQIAYTCYESKVCGVCTHCKALKEMTEELA